MTLRRRLASLLSPAKKSITSSEYWNSKYQTEEFIYTKTANRFVIELCESLAPGTAIDLAGGEGRNTVWLAEHGWRVENVDISAVGLAKCNQFAIERGVGNKVSTLEASGADFVSTLAPADLGIVPYLQVEQTLLERSLSNLVSQLKSGGHLVGVWHALENLDGGFGGPQDPKVLPSLQGMRDMCARLPLEVISCELRDGQVQTRDGLKPSTTLVLFARVL
jgi:SAM-dependent methyltransferase